MQKVFILCRGKEEVGAFRITFSRKYGLEYNFIRGERPSWQDIVFIVASMVQKYNLADLAEEISGNYKLIPNDTFDIRFFPLLVNNGSKKTIPVWLECEEILDDRFEVDFTTTMRCLVACGLVKNEGDSKIKIDVAAKKKVFNNKRRKNAIVIA